MGSRYVAWVGIMLMVAIVVTACATASSPATTATDAPTTESIIAAQAGSAPATASAAVAGSSNPDGPGQAATLAGNLQNGSLVYKSNCQVCHGATGTGGVPNPGSNDGTVPAL